MTFEVRHAAAGTLLAHAAARGQALAATYSRQAATARALAEVPAISNGPARAEDVILLCQSAGRIDLATDMIAKRLRVQEVRAKLAEVAPAETAPAVVEPGEDAPEIVDPPAQEQEDEPEAEVAAADGQQLPAPNTPADGQPAAMINSREFYAKYRAHAARLSGQPPPAPVSRQPPQPALAATRQSSAPLNSREIMARHTAAAARR